MVYYGRLKPERPRGRDAWGKVWGKVSELPCPLQGHHTPQIPCVFTSPEAVQTLAFQILTVASLHKMLVAGRELGLKVPTFQLGWVLLTSGSHH